MIKGRGFVIAIDGPDGVGKTTQLKLLASYLEKDGRKVHRTRSSGGTPMSAQLRKASLSSAPRQPETDLYISLAMQTDVGIDIQKHAAKGEVVLVDRSPLAIIAYQVFADGLKDKDLGFEACKKMLELWDIDYLIVLDAPESILVKRRRQRAKEDSSSANNYFEKQPAAYHLKTQDGYRAAAKFAEPFTNVVKVSAVGTVSDIQKVVRSSLKV